MIKLRDILLEKTPNKTVTFNGKKININSIKFGGVNRRDYPEFEDAYVSYAEYTDGKKLTDKELKEFQNKNWNWLYSMIEL